MVGFSNVGRSIYVVLRKIIVACKHFDPSSSSITAGNSPAFSVVLQFPNIKRSYLSCALYQWHTEINRRLSDWYAKPFLP